MLLPHVAAWDPAVPPASSGPPYLIARVVVLRLLPISSHAVASCRPPARLGSDPLDWLSWGWLLAAGKVCGGKEGEGVKQRSVGGVAEGGWRSSGAQVVVVRGGGLGLSDSVIRVGKGLFVKLPWSAG